MINFTSKIKCFNDLIRNEWLTEAVDDNYKCFFWMLVVHTNSHGIWDLILFTVSNSGKKLQIYESFSEIMNHSNFLKKIHRYVHKFCWTRLHWILILRNWEQSYLWSSDIGPLVEWNLACADGGMERVLWSNQWDLMMECQLFIARASPSCFLVICS